VDFDVRPVGLLRYTTGDLRCTLKLNRSTADRAALCHYVTLSTMSKSLAHTTAVGGDDLQVATSLPSLAG
jgi:hypothetical protein